MHGLKSVSLVVSLLLVNVAVLVLPSAVPIAAVAETAQNAAAAQKAEAKRLLDQGVQAYQTRQYEAALQSWKHALTIYQAIQDRNGEANVLMNLGVAYGVLWQYDQAATHFQQALLVFQQVNDQNGEAKVLMNLGELYGSQRQNNQAKTYYQQALPIFQQVKDQNGEAFALMGLGNAYLSTSQYDQAKTYYQQALPIFQQIQNRIGEAKVLMNLGEVYLSQSQYSQAITFYRQALPIFQQVKDQNGEAKVLNNLGNTYLYLSQYSQAITFYRQALPIFQQVKDQNGEASALNNLGNVHLLLSQYDQAITYYQQALPRFQQVKDPNGEAKVLMNLGNAHLFLSQYDQAITYYQQALPRFQRIQNHNDKATALMNLGIAYQLLLRYGKAIAYYQQALPIYQQVKDREGEGKALNNIGKLLTQQKQPELAIVFYKQSVNIRETIRQDLRQLPHESQESYTQSVAGTYRSLADLLIQQGRLPEAQAVLELLKLRELRDFTRDAGIDSPGINLANIETTALKAILDRFTTLGNFTGRLAKCQRTNCPDLKTLEAQRDTLNEAVNFELKQQRAVLAKYFSTESATLTPEKLNAEANRIVNAQPGTVLIYPLVLKDKIQFLLALKAGDGAVTFRPIEVPNVSAETLFKTIQTFREQLKSPGDLKVLQATSKQLYDWLIKPLASEIPPDKVRHLVFAPDSTIRYIPLAALYDGKRYLIERYSISTITAASQTNTTETFASLPVNATFLLAMGASTFPNLAPLKNVPAELGAIVQASNVKDTHGIYPGSEFLNLKFDYEALKDHLKNKYRILHIATHGKFKPGRPEDSYLVPGRGDTLTTDRIDQLLNYGISNVHLVVLSACETAVGDRASDGIEIPGISYFFLKNDVKAVLASLWSVNDASTALMMQQFYTQLATGKRTKAEALQTVQHEFIKGKLTAKDAPTRSDVIPQTTAPGRTPAATDFTHPYYWAPFILIGNSL
ncbi:MAG: tetratricopeptide repeat protein [Tildeniella nuda ZEHNDER 1965/U140]|nr:tetratricopeptide repeat protein [Tildeniella nuda ZEHNDER 1965/U140]